MAGAGATSHQLRPTRRIRPQAPEAAVREHHDTGIGDRDFRDARVEPDPKADPDCYRRCAGDSDAISTSALHLHDVERGDDVNRDRSLSGRGKTVAAASDVRAMG